MKWQDEGKPAPGARRKALPMPPFSAFRPAKQAPHARPDHRASLSRQVGSSNRAPSKLSPNEAANFRSPTIHPPVNPGASLRRVDPVKPAPADGGGVRRKLALPTASDRRSSQAHSSESRPTACRCFPAG